MINNKKILGDILGISIGAFSVSTLSNLLANELSDGDMKFNKKAVILSLSGIILSATILYVSNKEKIKNNEI